jgi:ATP-dependent Clp protease adaptor protein ClpS
MSKTDKDINVVEKERTKYKKPRNFKVLIHNDDYTPVDFVGKILTQVFGKTTQEAVNITQEAHTKGKAVVGIYTKEVAETKSAKSNAYARSFKYPFTTTIEPE